MSSLKSRTFPPKEQFLLFRHRIYSKKTVESAVSDAFDEVKMEGVSTEAQMSIAASSMFPGFRFSPTDEELISFYLRKKIEGSEKSVEIISQIELCRHEPWDLPAKAIIQSESEWFFFSLRGRKYPNGLQSRRATELGYWKATGKERNVKSNAIVIGTKRTLVYHMGRAPKGERTEWIMHEYCMIGRAQDSLVICRLRKNSEFHLNDSAKQASSSRRELSFTVDSSSVESQNIEQIDSTPESNPKTVADVGQSSNHPRDDENDDFYADILKDDIIDLDDSSLPTRPDLIPLNHNLLEADEISRRSERDLATDPFPPQGNANRRLRLEKDTRSFYEEAFDPFENSGNKNISDELEIGKSQMSPICIMSVNVFSSRTINCLVRIAVFVVLILLAWSLSSMRGSWVAMKRILFKSLSQGGWH